MRFCGNFHVNLRYCSFTTLSGLRLLQTFSRAIRWKKKFLVLRRCSVFIGFFRIFLLEARAKCFVLQRISLQINPVVSNCRVSIFINRLIQWYVDLVTFRARHRLGISVDHCYLPSLISWIYLPFTRAGQRQGKIEKWQLAGWRLSISFICIWVIRVNLSQGGFLENSVRFAVIWHILVRYCGFRTPLTPPSLILFYL